MIIKTGHGAMARRPSARMGGVDVALTGRALRRSGAGCLLLGASLSLGTVGSAFAQDPSFPVLDSYLRANGYLKTMKASGVDAGGLSAAVLLVGKTMRKEGGPAMDLDGEVERSATKRLQRRLGLPQTGTADAQLLGLISRSRCALPDVDPLGQISTGPWQKRKLTYAIGSLAGVMDGDVRRGAARALATWANAGIGLSFQLVERNAEPDIVFEMRPENDPDRSMVGPLVAHADLPPPYRLTSEPAVPVHLKQGLTWSTALAPASYDIETTLLHELGHAIGLLHLEDSSAVMNEFTQAGVRRVALTTADIAAAKRLYAAAQPKE